MKDLPVLWGLTYGEAYGVKGFRVQDLGFRAEGSRTLKSKDFWRNP